MDFTFWHKSLGVALAIIIHVAILFSINVTPKGIKQPGLDGQKIELVSLPSFVPDSVSAEDITLEEVETIEIIEEVEAIEIKEIETKVIPKEAPKVQVKKKVQEKKIAKKIVNEIPKIDSIAKTDSYHNKEAATPKGSISTASASNRIEADYKSIISAILQKHKQYPSRALRRNQEGTVTIEFTIKKNGDLEGYKIKNSSGHKLLDRAVEKMLKRAIPLPPFPESMQRNKMTLVLPIGFYIRS